MPRMVNCPFCGKLTDPQLQSCPHCGGFVQGKTTAPRKTATRGRQTCPSCQAVVQEGDIICVVCGTNLLTGQKVAAEAAKPRAGARKNPAAVLSILAVLVIAGLVAGLWIYMLNREPVNQALRLIDEGSYLEAQDLLSAYVDRVGDDERALFELGKLQYRNATDPGQYMAAASTFERVVSLNGNHVEAARMGVVALEIGARAAGRPRQMALLDTIVRVDDSDATAWFLLAMARGAQDDLVGQTDALQRVLTLDPRDQAARWGMAVGLMLNGDYGGAERELAQAGAAESSANLRASLGFLFSMRHTPENAIKQLELAVASSQMSVQWQALTQLGKLLVEAGRYGDAVPYLEQALTLNRNNYRAQYLHAVALEAEDFLQEALSEFDAISKDANNPFAAKGALQSAHIYLAMGNTEGARTAVERAGRLGASGAAFFTVQGRALARTGEEASGQDALKKAIAADPAYAPAYLESGLLWVKRDYLNRGLEDLDRYLQIIGTDTDGTRAFEIRALTEQLRQTAS